MIILMCVRHLARKVPVNYLLLLLFTMCEAYCVAGICSFYETKEVVGAMVTTAGMTLGLTIYAFCTKTDFTMMGGILFILSLTLPLVALFGYFWYSSWVFTFVSAILIIIFGIFLVFDT
mmetsp:Transcript_67955/g.94126  ORF Transcript_67955/g.94126 Transcript_67955/m.94126 type:complete len:119 (+) Transcript_67955:213-569(+)